MSISVLHSLWPILLAAMEDRFCHLTEHLPEGRVVRQGSVLSCLSGWASDTFNTVLGIPTHCAQVDATTALYHRYRWPACWWLPEEAPNEVRSWLHRSGWQPAETDMAMAKEIRDLPVISQRPDFVVKEVTGNDDMQLFGRIISTIFEDEAPVEAAEVREVYAAMTPPIPSQQNWQLLMGFERGVPVATASLFIKSGIASLNDIATHPSYRRRGVGTAMFEAALQRIHHSGAEWCVLQASEAAQSLYARQGFSALGTIETWSLADEP